jgi:hypothetical protein
MGELKTLWLKQSASELLFLNQEQPNLRRLVPFAVVIQLDVRQEFLT